MPHSKKKTSNKKNTIKNCLYSMIFNELLKSAVQKKIPGILSQRSQLVTILYSDIVNSF
jgi:hypothetical protein